jgi:uncharacterized protein (DUF302 family)
LLSNLYVHLSDNFIGFAIEICILGYHNILQIINKNMCKFWINVNIILRTAILSIAILENNEMNLMQKMMFSVYKSELDFEETVSALTASAQKNGWKIPMSYDLQKGYHEAGLEDMTKMKIIYFCNPEGGYEILQEDANKPMSVMMPMGVSVYETNDGEVHVSGMNLGGMSKVFGGAVKEVLSNGATNYAKSLADFAQPEEHPGEIQVDGGKCALGCLSVTAIIGGLVALVVWIGSKLIPVIMPKMMSTMMPKMMEAMDEAGIQPPCAQIILDSLEDK